MRSARDDQDRIGHNGRAIDSFNTVDVGGALEDPFLFAVDDDHLHAAVVRNEGDYNEKDKDAAANDTCVASS